MHRFLICLVAATAVAALRFGAPSVSDVDASTAVPVDVEDLMAGAELVVEGRVTAVRTLDGPDGRIDTEYTLAVERTFWGADLDERLVRLPGGIRADGSGLLVPGVPRFSFGEELLLALTDSDLDGLRMPVGLEQGCYRLRRTQNGDRIAWRGPATSARIDPATGRVRHGAASMGIPYGELAARLIAAGEARRAGALERVEDR